jgi:hypothetical protein
LAGTGKTDAAAWRSPSDGEDAVALGGFATASVATSSGGDVLRTEEQTIRRPVGSGEVERRRGDIPTKERPRRFRQRCRPAQRVFYTRASGDRRAPPRSTNQATASAGNETDSRAHGKRIFRY